ncbi:copper chaperone PCu(A)C [Acetobacter oeni]|uniref:Copper chaperone PCu(A)C n=1 Tax=Acetobacter oeni TaxID=304077 RepID=A0A511XJA5_9PROT|nr:copper chaperone PCu(A)C [Acetobacter oeni]MBB3882813.1 hypothetical protein [Acetobacter oeni]NHO18902.1 copper chaperone PCu(A)C [Acetobacter oeni]GBR09609.1 hypothetical protein AA21952_2890 [Acetobacter oeni LMG 21952]GEN63001.1 hypothetical protein AOE01nite_12250 [Acetobacter oeni]
MKDLCALRNTRGSKASGTGTPGLKTPGRRLLACLAAISLTALVPQALAAADSQTRPSPASTGQEADIHPNVSGANVPGQDTAAAEITIHDGWMQHVSPRADLVAVYFSVENTSDRSHLIDRITSPSCSEMFGYHSDLEISTLTHELFTHLTLPAKQTLVFPPGGYHLVCHVAPGTTIAQGSTVDIEFHFLGGTRKTVAFQVREAKQFRKE